MIQYIDISTDGEVQIVSGKSNQCVFELSDPDIPVDIKYLLDTLLNVDPQAGLVAVHLERGNGREFTTVTYSGGIVLGSDGVSGQFDVIISNLPRLAAAIGQVPLPPPPPRIPNLSFAQLIIGLVSEEWITETEGGAWLVGTLPETVVLVISMLPADQRFAATARAIRPSVIVRDDPLVNEIAVAQGKTSEEIDAFFITYSAA